DVLANRPPALVLSRQRGAVGRALQNDVQSARSEGVDQHRRPKTRRHRARAAAGVTLVTRACKQGSDDAVQPAMKQKSWVALLAVGPALLLAEQKRPAPSTFPLRPPPRSTTAFR